MEKWKQELLAAMLSILRLNPGDIVKLRVLDNQLYSIKREK